MIGIRIINFLIAGIMFILSISELYKGVLMVFSNQTPILFMAMISFWLLRLLPETKREEKYQHALRVYTKRKGVYGVFAIVGGAWGILVAYLIAINA